MSTFDHIKFGDGLTVTDEGGNVIRVDAAAAAAAGGGPAVLYESLLGTDTATLDTGAGGIASGYKVLELWAILRTDEAAVRSACKLTFNNDSGANYNYFEISGTSGSVTGGGTSNDNAYQFTAAGANDTANYFSLLKLTLPFYTETTAYKIGEAFWSVNPTATVNSDWRTRMTMIQWLNTAAITRIKLEPFSAGPKFKVGSHLLITGR